jgi:hypothetical protein
LLAEASDLGVEFDELQQLSLYEAQCNSWRSKASSAVSACIWLNVICSSSSDADDGDQENDDDEDVDSEESETGIDPQDAGAAGTLVEDSSCLSPEGPPVIDVKEILASSWWFSEDIQARISLLVEM